ncbi:MAG TPA: sigma-54-dependent Fis family transcriptional regulator, partial [Fibrobacteraceae bacterium]|nr:sigma-54-dependent Fis family transcriptional regulator [Fibrobacteraceae bacterium]
MKQPIGSEILVIQKISAAIIHERNVNNLLENVLTILDTEMGLLRGTFTLLFGRTLKIEASHG